VELAFGVGVGAAKLHAQQLAEEVVVAVPRATGVEGDEEEVRVLDVGQDARGVIGAEHCVAEGRGEAVEDRRPEQEPARLLVEAVEDLGREVVGDVTVVGGEVPDDVAWGVGAGEPERGEADAGGPSLRAADEQLDFLGADRDAGALEQLSGLGDGEGEVTGPEFAESAARPEPAEPPPGIRAGRT
jgi:hypothetical protein